MTRYINFFKIKILEQRILAGGLRKHLHTGKLLKLIIKRGKDKKRFHKVVTSHIVVFDSPLHWGKLMEMTENDQNYLQVVQIHYLLCDERAVEPEIAKKQQKFFEFHTTWFRVMWDRDKINSLVTSANVPVISMPKLVMIYKPLLKKDTSIVRLIDFKKEFCSKILRFPRPIYPLKMKLFLENEPNRLTFFFKYLLDFTISISKLVKPESLKNGF